MKSRFRFFLLSLSMVFALACLPADLRAEDAPAAGGGVTVTTEAPVQPQNPGQPGAVAGEKNPARKEEDEDEAAQKAGTLDRLKAVFRGKQDLAKDLAAARGDADKLKERVAALEKELAAVKTERDQMGGYLAELEAEAAGIPATGSEKQKPQTPAAETVQAAVNSKVAAELRNIGHKPAEKPKAAEAGQAEGPVNRVAAANAYWAEKAGSN